MGQRLPTGKQRNLQSYLYIILHFFTQFFFAITGGLQLIVPLLIMVYVRGKTASVVTTCVAVCGFAVQLAIWSSLAQFVELSGFWFFRLARSSGVRIGASFESKDIIAATFAYAAVLVVFVGTST
jgi:membrane-associated HD superfamily phosphohydrolase